VSQILGYFAALLHYQKQLLRPETPLASVSILGFVLFLTRHSALNSRGKALIDRGQDAGQFCSTSALFVDTIITKAHSFENRPFC
jgi:hypothetical protein